MKYIPEKMTYKEYEQSKTVRHIADTVGFMYIFMLVLQFVWEFPVLKLLMSFGLSLKSIQQYLLNPAIMLAVNVLLSAVIFLVPFITLCTRERQKPSQIIHFGAPENNTFLPLVALGSGLCMAANALSSIITQILEQFGIKGKDVLEDMPQGWWGVALCVVAVSLAPAFLEEFAFRGVVFGTARRAGEGFAIFVSAIMFSLMHLNISQIPFAFFAGIIIGFVYVKSQSIWTAMAVHAINNLISLALGYALDRVSQSTGDFISYVVIAASCIVSLLAFFVYSKRGGNFKLHSSDIELKTKNKALCFLKSPTIIVSIIATVIILIVS